jgi:hypothetical protein
MNGQLDGETTGPPGQGASASGSLAGAGNLASEPHAAGARDRVTLLSYMSECRNRQTGQLEVLVPSGACGFKSRFGHVVEIPVMG